MERHRFIALCGAPMAGKSTIAGVLERNFGYRIIDDKEPLRTAAMDLYGLTHDQVFTQSGKSEIVRIGETQMTVREVLGELAKFHEKAYGANFFAIQAIEKAKKFDPIGIGAFVFPSVRMQQGWEFKKAGGLVIEVRNPQARITHDFDQYDAAAVDGVINNSIGMPEDDQIAQFRDLLMLEEAPAFSC